MVRKGKTAKTIACKEAEVKRVKGASPAQIQDGEKRAKGVASAQIQDGEKRAKGVASAQIQDGEKRAKGVASAQIQDGERGAKGVAPVQVQDGGEGAGEVHTANIRDVGKDTAHAVPISVQKAELEEKVLRGWPEKADENLPAVQQRYPARADSGLTLAQLFGRN